MRHLLKKCMLSALFQSFNVLKHGNSHARQVKGDDTDKKGYPGPPGWGFGVGLTTPHSKKLIITKVEQKKKLDGFNDDGESW
jgi:hypothetical protein